MMGAAALAFGFAIVSCSSNDDIYNPDAQSDLIEANYQKAFIHVFGQPASNHTWGFGAPTRATRALGDYDAFKGSMQPVEWYQDTEDWQMKTRVYTFPSDCDASNFLTDVPEGVLKYTEVAGMYQTGYATGISYLDPSWTNEVNIWGEWNQNEGKKKGGTLYITGDNDFSSRKFTVCENTDVYLLEGATLKLNDADAKTIKFNLYIAPSAKLIADGTEGRVKLDNGAKLYNHGEIECKTFEVNNTSMLYNGSVGKLTTTGEVYVANANSIIVNDGEITSGTESNKTGMLVTAGSGRVQNNAEWTVYGETIINSDNNIWVNNGHFITENYTYTATSSSVINNCFLTVNENFCMNIADGSGDFKIDAGGGVLTKNFYGGGKFTAKDNNNTDVTFNGGPFKIVMGSKSVFKVVNEAHMNALASGIADKHYGFEGVGSDYAVLEAAKIVKDGTGEGNVAYTGNLYVSAGEHFAQGYSGTYPYIHYCENSAGACSKDNIYAPGDDFTDGKPAITIKATLCNPGFEGQISTQPSLRVMAEDLSAGEDGDDFDFNDVVFDVTRVDKTHAKITLQAAGGTLPLRINSTNGVGGWEVHQLFGVANNVMVNTKAKAKGLTGDDDKTAVTKDAQGKDLIVEGNFPETKDDFNAAVKGIRVEVQKVVNGEQKWFELKAEVGQAACKIGVPTDFHWAWERTNVNSAFNFDEWVQNPRTPLIPTQQQ